VERIEIARDAREHRWPFGFELLVEQSLREGQVADAREAVVVTMVVRAALALELALQPLTAVEADLDVEREPGLDPSAHEPEQRVNPVLVDVETLARSELETSLRRILRAVVLERHARLQRRERTDNALLDRMRGENLARGVLLADAAGREVLDRSLFGARGLLHAFGGREREVLEIEKPYRGAIQEVEHAVVAHQREQVAAKHHPIESREHTSYDRSERAINLFTVSSSG
jgi:hypothetical protein